MRKIVKSKMFLFILKCQYIIWEIMLGFIWDELLHMLKAGDNEAIIVLLFCILLTALLEFFKTLISKH